MYESPITITERIVDEIRKQQEDDIMSNILTAIVEYGIDINKNELIKALQYDREQYNKGYMDGCRNTALKLYQKFRDLFIVDNPNGYVCISDIVEMLESINPGGDY